ncbi:MAG: class I SAM-dependent RNA methyltransferase [Bacteroidetes bacterium]|nr:MAG: class I SAM-dependent RNA methyltransferase [Bacteroidota bacterium]
MSESFPIIAKTLSGLEGALAAELQETGIETELLYRAVRFTGTNESLYRVNYGSRLALRFLKQLATFQVGRQEDLYIRIKEFPWEQFISEDQTLAIDAVVSDSVFTNSLFVAQKAKDAIADRFRLLYGKRPSVDLDQPDLRINIHINKEQCTVSLDSSGHSLHKREYRKRTWEAPISEVLAAGLIRLSGWDLRTPLYDPMCGSGTIPMEAAMLVSETPAGFFRSEFAFEKWRDYNAELWNRIKSEADNRIKPVTVPIMGSDKARQAIHAARINVQKTHLGSAIRFSASNFHATKPPFESGLMLMNPPYDERIQLDDAIAFYRSLGDAMKNLYPGWQVWIISSDLKALKFVGLKPSRKIPLFNGPLECRFVRFDLYEGRKTKDERSKKL